MNSHERESRVLVPLPASFVDALLRVGRGLNVDLMGALEVGLAEGAREQSDPPKGIAATGLPQGKYAAEFLGVRFAVWTLPEVFGTIVDMTAKVAPEALESLSQVRARTRRFLARDCADLHPGNAGLPVMRTESGWWISKNVGQEDLRRGLRALSDSAGLTFGKDVKFPLVG